MTETHIIQDMKMWIVLLGYHSILIHNLNSQIKGLIFGYVIKMFQTKPKLFS